MFVTTIHVHIAISKIQIAIIGHLLNIFTPTRIPNIHRKDTALNHTEHHSKESCLLRVVSCSGSSTAPRLKTPASELKRARQWFAQQHVDAGHINNDHGASWCDMDTHRCSIVIHGATGGGFGVEKTTMVIYKGGQRDNKQYVGLQH